MFFNLASVSYDEARKSRDKVIKRMTKEQIAEGQKLTREWLERKAANQSRSEAIQWLWKNAKENGE